MSEELKLKSWRNGAHVTLEIKNVSEQHHNVEIVANCSKRTRLRGEGWATGIEPNGVVWMPYLLTVYKPRFGKRPDATIGFEVSAESGTKATTTLLIKSNEST